MLNFFQTLLISALQGVTELFPISSLGHSVILPKLLGWNINQSDPQFVALLVATHLGTATVLFFYFFKTWQKIIAGFFRSLKRREIRDEDKDAKLAWLLFVATIPAGLLGLLFKDKLESLFATPNIVAFVLILNGALLLFGDILRARSKIKENTSHITWGKSILIGLMQCLALIPGISRTGSTLTGGLLSNLSYEDAANFSFLLATPIIGAAGILKIKDILAKEFLLTNLLGAIAAGLFAYLSVRFLTKYFKTQKLWPFAIYCVAIGILSTILFSL